LSVLFFRRLLLVAIVYLVCSGCDYKTTSNKASNRDSNSVGQYKIVSSALASISRGQKLFWLTEDAVLFPKMWRGADGRLASELGIWEISKNTYSTLDHPFEKKGRVLCRDNEWYMVADKSEKKARFYWATLDVERMKMHVASEPVDQSRYRMSPSSEQCELKSRAVDKSKNTSVHYLNKAGVILVGESLKIIDSSLISISDGGLIHRFDGFSLSGLYRYSQSERAYTFIANSFRKDSPLKIDPNDLHYVVINENGSVSEFPIPYFVSNSRPKVCDHHLSSQGLILSMAILSEGADKETDGLYLLDKNNKFNLIVEGVVGFPSVSPDGCRLAFIHKPFGSPGFNELKYTNLCAAAKKNTSS